MLSADWFESTPLFRKFWPKLLKSFALDAIAATGQQDAVDPCTVEHCVSFLKEISSSRAETEEEADGQRIVRTESPGVIGFSYYDSATAEPSALETEQGYGLGGFGSEVGSAVHGGAFAK